MLLQLQLLLLLWRLQVLHSCLTVPRLSRFQLLQVAQPGPSPRGGLLPLLLPIDPSLLPPLLLHL